MFSEAENKLLYPEGSMLFRRYHYERNSSRDGNGRMKNKPKRKRRGKKGFRMMKVKPNPQKVRRFWNMGRRV